MFVEKQYFILTVTLLYVYSLGPDVVHWFLDRILNITQELKDILNDTQRIEMRPQDWRTFRSARKCSICGKTFALEDYEEQRIVRDHDHITGRFRGAAHNMCNLQLQKAQRIPVFFHNFRGYDAHLITLALDKFKGQRISLIAQGYEKYLTMRLGYNTVFKDSYQFLGYSLDNLAAELLRSGEERFHHMRNLFPTIPDNTRRLLYQKGKFPYEYMDCWERFSETSLPPMERFDSSLKHTKCTQEEYIFAKKVWTEFNCNTMKDYQDLYLKTDVILLADIFENFRKFSMENYKLDPVHYVSSPQLSWDAMLLYTEVRISLMHDPAMFHMVDSGIRGGVAMIVKRYAKANNPEMGEEYKPDERLSYIVYVDANNLYGWAMSQSLPIEEYTWLTENEWSTIKWGELTEESEYGYIIECDLDYPAHLHDTHSDYPLAPEKRMIDWQKYSETQLRILSHYSIPKSSLKVD